ncbi:MAG: hypothetical protein ACLPJH_13275 [Myxococcaceae bacterium]
MTGLGFLGLLLVASYLGGFVLGGKHVPGRGLASGAGVVLLGFAAGPAALGLVSQDSLELFTPLAQVGVGWLAMDAGLVFGRVVGRPVRPMSAVWGVAIALVCAAGVSGTLLLVMAWLPRASPSALSTHERWVLVLGTGAALSETTRSVFRWAARRYGARGPLFNRLADIAAGDDLVPVALAAVAVALQPVASAFGPMPPAAGAVAQPLFGWLLGVAAALMLGRTFRLNVFRGVLLGVTLIAIGFTVRLGLSLLAVPFGLGLGLATVSRHRARVRKGAVSERFVLLPVLFLAGAMTSLDGPVPWLAAAGVAARLVFKLVAGLGLWASWPDARPAGPSLGLGLVSSGALSVAVGLSFALGFPGVVGSSVLAASTLSVVVGELVGPASLKRALGNAGELHEAPPETAAGSALEASS